MTFIPNRFYFILLLLVTLLLPLLFVSTLNTFLCLCMDVCVYWPLLLVIVRSVVMLQIAGTVRGRDEKVKKKLITLGVI